MALYLAGKIVERKFFVEAELAFVDKKTVIRVDQQISSAEKERESEKKQDQAAYSQQDICSDAEAVEENDDSYDIDDIGDDGTKPFLGGPVKANFFGGPSKINLFKKEMSDTSSNCAKNKAA